MRRLILALGAALALALPAQAQEVERFIGRDNKVKTVTPDRRLPVTNGPLADPASALDSVESHAQTSGVPLASPAVFYSVTITLTSGQGPGRVMIWDRTTVPADGVLSGATLPLRCFYVDAGDRTTVFGSAIGLSMDTGISWSFSSGANCQTLTRATANFVAVSYKAMAQ